MYKETRWAKEIIKLQQKDGMWGNFHTLSGANNKPITTERAIRRLEILGYTINDECIEKAVTYMHNCLVGKNEIHDRREKIHDWDVFTQLMLATWILRFTKHDVEANRVADAWSSIISSAFKNGVYSHANYLAAYKQVFSKKVQGDRLIDFVSFYQVSLISDKLDYEEEGFLFDYIMQHTNGIYYLGNNSPLHSIPDDFKSKQASRFLATIELMSLYKHNHHKLQFVIDWLNKNKDDNGKWDMGSSVKDYIYFPLSDSWRTKETRISDCTYRIQKLLDNLKISQ